MLNDKFLLVFAAIVIFAFMSLFSIAKNRRASKPATIKEPSLDEQIKDFEEKKENAQKIVDSFSAMEELNDEQQEGWDILFLTTKKNELAQAIEDYKNEIKRLQSLRKASSKKEKMSEIEINHVMAS